MIDLRKKDSMIAAIEEILQQEALKGNQHLIDKNKNNKVDPEDFKILRGEKKTVKEEETVDEGIKELAKKAFKAVTGGSDEDQRKDLQRKMGLPQTGKKPTPQKEEVVDESLLGQLRDRGNVATGQKQQDRKNFDTNTGAALKPNSTISGIRAKMQNKVQEESEQIDELSKSTLGSYIKKAAADSTISRKIGADFENRANSKRSPAMKDASIALSDKFKSDSRKRKANVDKAVDRLTKEEAEQQEEAMSHQAKTTMKHIPNPSPALKKAAKDIKPGVAGYRDRIDMLRAGGVKEEKQPKTLRQFKEGWEEMMADVKKRAEPKPNGGSGVKQGSRYGGSKQKDTPEQDTEKK